MKMKFDITYFVVTDQMVYQKYPKLCELQMRHTSVHLVSSYLNENAAKEFVQYIAESKLQSIVVSSESSFFSLLMDRSTDASNSENEIMFVMWCDVSSYTYQSDLPFIAHATAYKC